MASVDHLKNLSTWLERVPEFEDERHICGDLIAKDELTLIADLEQCNQAFEELIPDKRACAQALVKMLDKDQTEASKLGEDGLPKDLLNLFGETFGLRKVDQKYGELFDFFDYLLSYIFENKIDEALQAAAKPLLDNLYTLLKAIKAEAKSIASLYPFKTFIGFFKETYGDVEDFLNGRGIDTQVFTNNYSPEQKKQMDYSRSVLSSTNDGLIEAFTGPIKYSSLTTLDDLNATAYKLIEDCIAGRINEDQFNAEYIEYASSLDDKLKALRPNDEAYQDLLVNFYGLREFIELGYDGEKYWDHVSELQEMVPENPDERDY